jgi:hypothetical protein
MVKKLMKLRKSVIPFQRLIVSVLVIISTISLLIFCPTTFAQNSSLIGSTGTVKDQDRIELSKVARSTITISNESTFVGGFNTTYSIIGPPLDIKNSKDLIVSSIIKDFANSSTIGYVKLSNSTSNSSGKAEIANPFASNEQIDQKVQELVDKSIEDATNAKTALIEIKCLFGNSLALFSCSMFPLVR